MKNIVTNNQQEFSMTLPLKKKPKVLVADDDEGIRDILSIIFQNAGCNVELKTSGEDLIKNKFSIPDIFLIDKQLSGISGLDVCRHLKSRKATQNIPVILISASPDISSLSSKAGAEAYIEKPFDINYLLQVVGKYIRVENTFAAIS